MIPRFNELELLEELVIDCSEELKIETRKHYLEDEDEFYFYKKRIR